MKRILASLLAAFAATAASAYDHTSYNQTGLVIQYDAEGNGANAVASHHDNLQSAAQRLPFVKTCQAQHEFCKFFTDRKFWNWIQ